MPCRASSVTVLSSSNSRSDPSAGIDQQQLAPGGAGFLDRLARERRRQQHVVHPHGAAAAFALLLRRREQRQRARVRDQQPAFGVGQQNRVGDRVDDAVEQRALAPLLAVALGQRLLPENLIELLAEDAGEPVQLRAERRAADEQEAERVLGEARDAERQHVKRRCLQTGVMAGRRRRSAAECGAGKKTCLRVVSAVMSGLPTLRAAP